MQSTPGTGTPVTQRLLGLCTTARYHDAVQCVPQRSEALLCYGHLTCGKYQENSGTGLMRVHSQTGIFIIVYPMLLITASPAGSTRRTAAPARSCAG